MLSSVAFSLFLLSPASQIETRTLDVRPGDRLAIIGDSITEQKQYSRIIETYLMVCRPELKVDVRQFGWGGETAAGYLNRMDADTLKFKPTLATTCYGMNDHGYRAYAPEIGDNYRKNMEQIVARLEAANVRVVVGSPGIIGKKPTWVKDSTSTADDMNGGLQQLRAIASELGSQGQRGFADVYGAMADLRDRAAQASPSMEVGGTDGVHPGGAGQAAMAYAFLKALGQDKSDLARFEINLKSKKATATAGHKVLKFDGKSLDLESIQYPFCTKPGLAPTVSEREAMRFVPFQQELGRFVLVIKNLTTPKVDVTWGDATVTLTREQATKGINLPELFPDNPFSGAFAKVDDRVLSKQTYETQQIKMIFRSEEYKRAPDWFFSGTEKVRSALSESVRDAIVPVKHRIVITKR